MGRQHYVQSLIRRPSPYRTSYGLEDLIVKTESGDFDLVLKDLSRRCMRENALRAKPLFLYDPLREISVYRDLLSPMETGAPAYFGSIVQPERDRYWLILGRADGVELYQVGDLTAWQEAARWLARFHGSLTATQVDALQKRIPLLRYDAGWYARWMQRAVEFCGQGTGEQAAQVRRLAATYTDTIERLLDLPMTVLHGEFFASNVLVEKQAAGWRVHPIDWEMAAIGPDLVDVAALIAGGWSEEEKHEIAGAYLRAATHLPAWLRDEQQFWRALACCRLQLAVQWVGWSSSWTPPAEHAQDWLSEAVELAAQLGVEGC